MIKNIMFDLGGVVINISYALTSLAFADLGANNFDEGYSQMQQGVIFDLFETGKISAQEFRESLKEKLNFNASNEQIDLAWNSMILDIPMERLDFVKNLQDNYRTLLLSNTNEIHFDYIQENFFKLHKQKFTGFFHHEYYSHLLGKRKPHPETFLSVLEETSLEPEETLFIDDSLQHIEGAQRAGLQTFHLTIDKSIFDIKCLLRL